MYKNIMLKLSGEALSGNSNTVDAGILKSVCEEIAEIRKTGCKVSVVVGGGNIVRGAEFEKLGFERTTADRMGMMGTIINAVSLESTLNIIGCPAKCYSALEVPGVVEIYDHNKMLADIEDKVIIFAAGTGHPYFSTDTCCALRSLQTKAECILIAKNGTDGVYDSDPKTNPNAKKYHEIHVDEMLEKNLKVIDLTATLLMKQGHIGAYVFNMNEKGNILKVVNGEDIGTKVIS